MDGETYRCEWVRCGKCKRPCCHGPYWYAYRRVAGKLTKRYVGLVRDDLAPPDASHPSAWWYAIMHENTATLGLALDVIGTSAVASLDEVSWLAKRRIAVLRAGGKDMAAEAAAVVAALAYVRKVRQQPA